MFRPEFRDLHEIERKRIVMPDSIRMRLNRLERPQPWQFAFLERLRVSLPLESLQQYPSYPAFYERLAAFLKVGPDEIVVGAGVEEFIRTLMMLCAAPGDKVAVLWPCCAMFEIYARAFGVKLVRIETDPYKPLTVDALLVSLPKDLQLMILPNPGQPVETCFDPRELAEIAMACEASGAVLAIDEAYFGFGAPTAIDLRHDFENVVILRSFSKAFGAASIRLGCAIGGQRVIRTLDAVRQSGEVSAISMHIAAMLMDRFEDVVAPGIKDVIWGRDYLRRMVQSEMALRCWGQHANHVLIEHPEASSVAERLRDRGVLVKADFPPPIGQHMLVTCGDGPMMHRFYEELWDCL